MKKLWVIPLLCGGLSMPSSVTWAGDFPDAGVDTTTSLGQFYILLTKEFAAQIGMGADLPREQRIIVSPMLSDKETKIGRSSPHADGDLTDVNGADVCLAGTVDSCFPHLVPNLVKDGDFLKVPPTNGKLFDEGPEKTKEVHTQIISFHLTDPKGSANAVRAGQATKAEQPRSIGEVESLNTVLGDFPAESFFNIFVEVDVDMDNDGTVDLGLYNKAPLLIQNDELGAFPPRVVYRHQRSKPVPVYTKITDPTTGEVREVLVGSIVLAGHGVGFDAPVDFFEYLLKNSPPSPRQANCGPGEHWIDDCPAGTDQAPSMASVTIVKPQNGSCEGITEGEPMLFLGPTIIERKAGVPHSIDTEIISMVLKGGPFTFRAGTKQGVAPATLGKITEISPTLALASFEVYFQVSTPWGMIHNQEPLLMEAIIDRVPSLRRLYFSPLHSAIGLYNENGELKTCLINSAHVLPVTLDYFTATSKNGAVSLEWATGTEKNNAGFFVWRGQPVDGKCSDNPDNYTNVQAITPLLVSRGTEVSGATYTMTDSNVVSGNTYCYALEDRGFNGKSTFHLDDMVSVTP